MLEISDLSSMSLVSLGCHNANYDEVGGREIIYLKTADGHVKFEQFKPGQKYCMRVQADKPFVLDGKTVQAPPSRPFYFYGPITSPKNVSARWDGSNLCVEWHAVVGAVKYELTLCTGSKERVVHVSGTSYSTSFPQSSKTQTSMPDRLVIRSVGGQNLDLYSERNSKASIPKRLLPPDNVSLTWKTQKRLAVQWDEVEGAKKYKVRLYNDTAAQSTSSRTVRSCKWEGDCKLTLPFKVTVSSIAEDDFESDESEQVEGPSHTDSVSKTRKSPARSPGSANHFNGKGNDNHSDSDDSRHGSDTGGRKSTWPLALEFSARFGRSDSEAEFESESDWDYNEEEDSDFESSLPFKGPKKEKDVCCRIIH